MDEVEASALMCDVTCASCGRRVPAGEPAVCLPDTAGDSDPWGCVACSIADGDLVVDEDGQELRPIVKRAVCRCSVQSGDNPSCLLHSLTVTCDRCAQAVTEDDATRVDADGEADERYRCTDCPGCFDRDAIDGLHRR